MADELLGGMRFCRSQGVELGSERVLPTKQREEEEEEERRRRERRGTCGQAAAAAAHRTHDACREESWNETA